jgi:GntR family transcriptional repressor for pyruvate dehydrogenase complex
MGIIETKSGFGTVISNSRDDILVERIKKASAFSPKDFLFELIELRQILEPHLAYLAAERANDEDLNAMKEAVEKLERENLTGGPITSADEKLHLAIARATHNRTLSRIIEPLMQMHSEFRERLAEVPGRRRKANEEHKKIYEAIRARRSKSAQTVMENHIKHIREALEKSVHNNLDDL